MLSNVVILTIFLDSLVDQKFLTEINVEMSDLGMDSVMYRFRNSHDQSVVNGMMLNDQKQKTHFEVAYYYTSHEKGESSSESDEGSNSLQSEFTTVASSNWELYHITALHYDLADAPLPAMLHYFDSSAQLASLGMRDRAHGRLLSAYLMLEKLLHEASSLNIEVDNAMLQRQQLTNQMVHIIGNKDLGDSFKNITKEHIRQVFNDDIESFKKGLTMLAKFGQSVGTIEVEGYKFASELYLQAISLVLLVLKTDAFANLTSKLASFLEQVDSEGDFLQNNHADETMDDSSFESGTIPIPFDIDDLSVSFPAFSGLLTFYRDSPIGANQVQETFLANMFVAVTQEANEVVHVLRTKCILSHLYLKHGKIEQALQECEEIKHIYDHDAYSLQLVNIYGMDWPLICVGTMASTYLFRGEFANARKNIEFLEEQLKIIDEFASSTKAMSKGTISSYYLLLHEFEKAAAIASGIASTQYGYFFKPHGTLQERLAEKELALSNQSVNSITDIEVLSVLSLDNINEIDQNRSMLRQSAETLVDRGIEAVQAAICMAEVRNLESLPMTAETTSKQLQYCQAGLIYLHQSLGQADANNHERRKNYLMCLYQKAHLLFWHQKVLQRLQHNFGDDAGDGLIWLEGNGIDTLSISLKECEALSKTYGYPYMQLLVGKSYIAFGIDVCGGEEMIAYALSQLSPSDCKTAMEILTRIEGSVHDDNLHK